MVARKRDELLTANLKPDWWGLAIIGLALIVALVGELATLYTLIQYAFLLTLVGFVVLTMGWRGLEILWAPLLYLAFMIPLPDFIQRDLSQRLQLFSSVIGVALIRFMGISVYIEGNMIDLGNYKLQVAEACSGLRYLFPLMSFGFLCAYLFTGRLWQKVVLFLSAIPIAVLMNSFRIAVIGILTETSGRDAAEGFLHLFEGWVVFVLCLLLLFGEAWLILRLSGRREPLADAFGLDLPNVRPLINRLSSWRPSPHTFAGIGLLSLACLAVVAMGARSETVPLHRSLVQFPLWLDEWRGQNVKLDPEIVRVLRVDDYFNANFVRPHNSVDLVNLYIAFYRSQRKGASVHSPRSCIPAGGWEIESVETVEIDGLAGGTLKANRVAIGKGAVRQIVYYWFEQRGRTLTDEYLVKWYILRDAVLSNRTDGALIRLVTPLQPWEQESEADDRLTAMVRVVHPQLSSYIPN
jgi:exosortase D (VPLPA-CTERM-specific)